MPVFRWNIFVKIASGLDIFFSSTSLAFHQKIIICQLFGLDLGSYIYKNECIEIFGKMLVVGVEILKV